VDSYLLFLLNEGWKGCLMSPKRSDIYEFQLANGYFGYCQVIFPGTVFYIAVFDEIFQVPIASIEGLSGVGPLLCGWTLDGRIHHGMWKLRGSKDIASEIPKPCYIIPRDGVEMVTSFEGADLRRATREDSLKLPRKTTVAPIRFEKALAAKFGLEPWASHYEGLLISSARAWEEYCNSKSSVL